MTDFHHLLTRLRRPASLVRAAQHGANDYDRSRHLARIAGEVLDSSPQDAIDLLLCREAEQEDYRVTRFPAYNAVRHLELLIAILGELRLLVHDPV